MVCAYSRAIYLFVGKVRLAVGDSIKHKWVGVGEFLAFPVSLDHRVRQKVTLSIFILQTGIA